MVFRVGTGVRSPHAKWEPLQSHLLESTGKALGSLSVLSPVFTS